MYSPTSSTWRGTCNRSPPTSTQLNVQKPFNTFSPTLPHCNSGVQLIPDHIAFPRISSILTLTIDSFTS